MPSLGNIVVNDGESTPVAHTFSPTSQQGSTAKLHARNSTTIEGWETLVVEVKQAAKAGQAAQVRIGLGDPVEATVNGQVQVVRTNSFEIKFNSATTSTAQERKNDRMLAINLLQHATIIDCIENVAQLY